jgi:hypothetical protein
MRLRRIATMKEKRAENRRESGSMPSSVRRVNEKTNRANG